MLRKIYAKLTGGRVVYLLDFDGELTTTIARRGPFGNLRARRMWPGAYVNLLDDGKVDGPSYVKRWAYANQGDTND